MQRLRNAHGPPFHSGSLVNLAESTHRKLIIWPESCNKKFVIIILHQYDNVFLRVSYFMRAESTLTIFAQGIEESLSLASSEAIAKCIATLV